MTIAIPETDYGILTRTEFMDEFEFRYRSRALPKNGQHVLLVGPSGRGKTTTAGEMLARVMRAPAVASGLITTSLGPDDALAHLGKPTKRWPPKVPLAILEYDESPLIRRFEPLPSRPEHFAGIKAINFDIFTWMFGRKRWILFIPDLQVICDPRMMGLGGSVEQLILTLRKLGSGIWMDAQAPRWIPRASNDQTHHLLIWRNRDELTIKRLKAIAGMDVKLLESIMADMDFHDFLWVDTFRDEYFHVLSQ